MLIVIDNTPTEEGRVSGNSETVEQQRGREKESPTTDGVGK